MEKIMFKKEEKIAFITINRPKKLNCFDLAALYDFEKIVQEIKTNSDIRIVIITGAGDKAFSAGADLKERKQLNEEQVRINVQKIRDVFTQIEELPQPTIAAINGFALGGGLELALACDFRYASRNAILGLTEVSWAIIPGAGGTQRLSRLIGVSKAKELILTARKIDASTALELGILNRVVEQNELINSAIDLAKEILQNGPLAVIQAKYAINNGNNVDLKTGLEMEAKAYEAIISTKDRTEALLAFSEGRQPQFKGV
ncbi:enoyl-CoA hydratase [Robertmurraya siralis]|uniref:Enoyl-CoA hydratase n=1 Tax=Robertmurraya siralis TaxID=77777 RepID=A0A920BSM5_9BACI|nr:enoyl-CoA hydratase-related protein [Robertmurraya siralis]PAE20132.1 enoyl-CoA hydratase [Bacillus sp. 7504-2]GIN61250.1 enoyl-CoA hydratase [Robertmurraya siralis]